MQREATHRKIDCPIPWCTGLIVDHGAHGDEPDAWVHSDAPGTPLLGAAHLCRAQVGAGPDEWTLYLRDDALTANSTDGIAAQLRALATLVEAHT